MAWVEVVEEVGVRWDLGEVLDLALIQLHPYIQHLRHVRFHLSLTILLDFTTVRSFRFPYFLVQQFLTFVELLKQAEVDTVQVLLGGSWKTWWRCLECLTFLAYVILWFAAIL